MAKMNDLSNRRFGKLLVSSIFERRTVGTKGKKLIYWMCKCDCGNTHWSEANNLVSGNCGSCGCNVKKPDGHSAAHSIFANYKCKARRKNREFKITKKYFLELVTRNCEYCDTPPSSIAKTKYNDSIFMYNGIDRVDNNVGYIVGNCVTCCETCNRAKLQMSKDEFFTWISKVFWKSVFKIHKPGFTVPYCDCGNFIKINGKGCPSCISCGGCKTFLGCYNMAGRI